MSSSSPSALSPEQLSPMVGPGRATVVPLTYRIGAMAVFRALITGLLWGIGLLAGVGDAEGQFVLAFAYLVFTAVSAGALRIRNQRVAVTVFGLSLLVDAAYLQYQRHRMGSGLATDLALAAFLVAVCLLASFRTGLKIAFWQSLLAVIVYQAEQSSLIRPGPRPVTWAGLVAELVLLWLVVVTASTTAAINERELRRRRYDAEALRAFAAQLHSCDRPEEVCSRVLQLVVDELEAVRALVCKRVGVELEAVAAHGTETVPPGVMSRSALLGIPSPVGMPVLALRLDPARDPWLHTAMPGARRLVAVRLVPGTQGPFLVLEHSRRLGNRVERRVLSTCVQAATTTSLALSRAQLLVDARAAASTDGLTGVLNRRSFDVELAQLTELHHVDGVGFAVVMIDIDRFKAINDTYGHQTGDEVLQAVAGILDEWSGMRGRVFRYGGEEFAVLITGLAASEAALVAERMRTALHTIDRPVRVSASFGVAGVPAEGNDGRAAVAAADEALLLAKRSGRDRVMLAVLDPATGAIDAEPFGIRV